MEFHDESDAVKMAVPEGRKLIASSGNYGGIRLPWNFLRDRGR